MGRKEVDDYFPTGLITGAADFIVSRGRCLVYGVTVCGVGGAGSVMLREGKNALGIAKLPVYAVENSTEHVGFRSPVLFELGCFADVAATTEVTIQYAPAPPDYTE